MVGQPVERPPEIPGCWNPKSMGVSADAKRLLAKYADANRPPTPFQARGLLPRWTCALGYFLQDQSRETATVIDEQLSAAPEWVHPEMDAWLAGMWSTRDALEQLAWRMSLSEAAVGAALYLFDLGEQQ